MSEKELQKRIRAERQWDTGHPPGALRGQIGGTS